LAPSIENPWQDVEKVRQHRSRIVQTLKVPQGYASGFPSLRPRWTAMLSIPRETSPVVPQLRTVEVLASPRSFPAGCEDRESGSARLTHVDNCAASRADCGTIPMLPTL